jgi:hypothetical protein
MKREKQYYWGHDPADFDEDLGELEDADEGGTINKSNAKTMVKILNAIVKGKTASLGGPVREGPRGQSILRRKRQLLNLEEEKKHQLNFEKEVIPRGP